MIAANETEKEKVRAAGKLLGEILAELSAMARPGTTGRELDEVAERLIRAGAAEPLFLGYKTRGASSAYPATLCLSVNDEVVHGIPKEERVLAEGDVVSLDLGLLLDGYSADAARTIIIGEGDADAKRLVAGTQEALASAIGAAKAGNTVGDIGAAVEAVAKKYELTVVRDLGGHGTGRKEFHEAPFVANFGKPGEGEELTEGMVLALEPIFTLGRGAIKVMEDGWTYATRDHSPAAHFEDTVLVGKNGAEVVSRSVAKSKGLL